LIHYSNLCYNNLYLMHGISTSSASSVLRMWSNWVWTSYLNVSKQSLRMRLQRPNGLSNKLLSQGRIQKNGISRILWKEYEHLLYNRFQFFLSDDWSDAKELRDQYRVAFQDALTPIQERLASAKGPQGSSTSTPRSVLHNLVRSQKSIPKSKPVVDEIAQYLDGSRLNPSDHLSNRY
jgi:hypothetical protein